MAIIHVWPRSLYIVILSHKFVQTVEQSQLDCGLFLWAATLKASAVSAEGAPPAEAALPAKAATPI